MYLEVCVEKRRAADILQNNRRAKIRFSFFDPFKIILKIFWGGVMKWELKRNPVLPVFQQPKPVHQPRGVCKVEEAVQQLRDELNVGPMKELREGERERKVEGQLDSLLQTKEV
jgi:hypothetical protein